MNISYRSNLIKYLSAAGLLLATLIWGGGFVFTKNSLDALPPLYLLAFRFTVAAAGLLAIFFKRLLRITRRELADGAILGALLFVSYLFQTYGIKYTTASKNAFITTLYVVFVPFLGWLISRRRPNGVCIFAAFLAMAGIGLLTLQGGMSVNIGDFLTLICSVCYALHILYIDRFTEKQDPVALTVIQVATAGVLSWAAAPLADGGVPVAALNGSVVFAMLYLGLGSTMLGFLLQTVGQKHLAPSTASLLLSMEAVFGFACSVIFLGEEMTPRLIAGCACIFVAVVLSETDPAAVMRKLRRAIEAAPAEAAEE